MSKWYQVGRVQRVYEKVLRYRFESYSGSTSGC
nr:MAG TPA: hypothetical protein [Caudoviricetes sp.]